MKELIAVVVDGYFDLWTDLEAENPKIHAKLPEEVEKVTKLHISTTNYSAYADNWHKVAFFIETIPKEDASTTRLYWAKSDDLLMDSTTQLSLEFNPTKEQNFSFIYSGFGKVLAIDKEGEIWVFYDNDAWFSSNNS